MSVGSLFAGYGGLDLGLSMIWPDARPAWFVEFDKHPSAILAKHWPDVPNYGDITTVDWSTVEPVDVLTGGYPCQPFSGAGQRRGTEDERHLWPHMANAIAHLRPALVIGENVRGHLSLGFDQVLRDFDLLGYDVQWAVIKASDAGAPHRRERIFVLGKDRHGSRICRGTDRRRGLYRPHAQEGLHLAPTGCGNDGESPADPAPVAGGVRGEGGEVPRRDGSLGGGLHLATYRGVGCCFLLREDSASSDSEEGASPSRAGAASPEIVSAEAQQRVSEVGRGEPAQGAHHRCPNDGDEQARPDAISSSATGGDDAGSSTSLGRVVGAEREPVRAGGVRGAVPDEWEHDRRSCVCTSDAGAPHRRERVFIVAAPHATDDRREWTGGAWSGRPGLTDDSDDAVALLPTPAVNDMGAGKDVEDWDAWTDAMKARHDNGNGHGKSLSIEVQRLLPTPRATDGDKGGPNQVNGRGVRDSLPSVVPLLPTPTAQAAKHGATPDVTANGFGSNLWDIPTLLPTPTSRDWKDGAPNDNVPTNALLGRTVWGDFGPYTAAIARWEAVLGRAAPSPTEPNRDGRPRLSPRFVEFMMGLPDGWVTDAGIPRNAQLKALGNGVVPQQLALALTILLPRLGES